jgi:hypothetical protein
LSGTKYSYAVTQLESLRVLHPDAHMFTQDDFYQSDPDVVAMFMPQLSLKAWGHKAHNAARNEMKQLHMRDTFKPKFKKNYIFKVKENPQNWILSQSIWWRTDLPRVRFKSY